MPTTRSQASMMSFDEICQYMDAKFESFQKDFTKDLLSELKKDFTDGMLKEFKNDMLKEFRKTYEMQNKKNCRT